MTTVLKLDEIKHLIDTPQLIREIETGFVLYSEGKVNVPPVGFLHFDDPLSQSVAAQLPAEHTPAPTLDRASDGSLASSLARRKGGPGGGWGCAG